MVSRVRPARRSSLDLEIWGLWLMNLVFVIRVHLTRAHTNNNPATSPSRLSQQEGKREFQFAVLEFFGFFLFRKPSAAFGIRFLDYFAES